MNFMKGNHSLSYFAPQYFNLVISMLNHSSHFVQLFLQFILIVFSRISLAMMS